MTIDELCKEFHAIASRDPQRLAQATKDRERLANDLAAGKKAHGPRHDWMLKVAQRIVDLLQDACEEFDAGNPEDAATAEDLAGILLTTLSMILEQAGMSLETDGRKFGIVKADKD
jgi:hypothetical protein